MKKKFLGIVAIATIITVTSWNFKVNKDEMTLSELTLANVEALANGESSGPKCEVPCCQTKYNECLAWLNQLGCTSIIIHLDTKC